MTFRDTLGALVPYAPAMGTQRTDKAAGSRLIIRVGNPTDARILVRIEPWGREYDLSPGAGRAFTFDGPGPADVEVEVRPNELTIWGWTGSVLDEIGPPVPPFP